MAKKETELDKFRARKKPMSIEDVRNSAKPFIDEVNEEAEERQDKLNPDGMKFDPFRNNEKATPSIDFSDLVSGAGKKIADFLLNDDPDTARAELESGNFVGDPLPEALEADAFRNRSNRQLGIAETSLFTDAAKKLVDPRQGADFESQQRKLEVAEGGLDVRKDQAKETGRANKAREAQGRATTQLNRDRHEAQVKQAQETANLNMHKMANKLNESQMSDISLKISDAVAIMTSNEAEDEQKEAAINEMSVLRQQLIEHGILKRHQFDTILDKTGDTFKSKNKEMFTPADE